MLPVAIVKQHLTKKMTASTYSEYHEAQLFVKIVANYCPQDREDYISSRDCSYDSYRACICSCR